MSTHAGRALLAAAALAAAFSGTIAPPAAAESGPADSAEAPALFDFEMEDQFGHVHRRSDYDGRVVLAIGSGRHGNEWNPVWGVAIHDSLVARGIAEQVDSFGVANVSGVPFFIKGIVRGKFPKDPEKWALVDWKGEFAKRYGWTEDEANVLVFYARGRLVARAHGLEPPEEDLQRLVRAISGAVEATRADPEVRLRPPRATKAPPDGTAP